MIGGNVRFISERLLYGEFISEEDANEYCYVKQMDGWTALSPVFKKEPSYEVWENEGNVWVAILYRGQKPL